jgi:hypothetical protein
LDSNALCVDEINLFERLIEWTDNQIEKQKSQGNNNNIISTSETIMGNTKELAKARTYLLSPFIEKIRFPLMNGEELHDVVEPYEVVPDPLLLEAYRFIASGKEDPKVILNNLKSLLIVLFFM